MFKKMINNKYSIKDLLYLSKFLIYFKYINLLIFIRKIYIKSIYKIIMKIKIKDNFKNLN